MECEFEVGQWVYHVPTEQVFGVIRRGKRKRDNAVVLFDNAGREFLAADCVLDDTERSLSTSELNTLVDMCEVSTTDDLELLETLNMQQKAQLWSRLSDETKERLKMLRSTKKQEMVTPWDKQIA